MANPTLKELTDTALDKAYAKTASEMLNQIVALLRAPNSAMQRSLKKLDDEADRLVEADEKMDADNAQLEQTLGEYRTSANTAAALISANDNAIQEAGQMIAVSSVTAKVFTAIAGQILASGRNPVDPVSIAAFSKALKAAGIPWVFPGAADFATGYVDTEAWTARLDGWGDGYANLTRDTMLKGIRQGWGPKRTATEMRKHAENIPASAAESLTRTLQVTSYRDAALGMEVVNSDYVTGKIRIAKLDDRTCLTCISLHGTPLELGERPDDHARGRCDVFYIVPGGSEFPEQMQADSVPGQRNFVPWQTGEDWFASLPAERQAQQASFLRTPAKLRAYRDGVPLSAFVGDHVDDVFGGQKVEQSLVKALGDSAEGYYTVNQ